MAEIAAKELDSLKKANKRASKKGRYTYGEVIGEGSFGTVLKATDTKNNDTVAIKILDFKRSCKKDEESAKRNANREVDILKQLSHENITCIKDDFEFQKWHIIPKGIAIVMEFCSKGSLSDLLGELMKTGSSVSKEQRLIWFKQLMSALAYIHSKSIAHRDIKPANILVDKDDRLKVADVGLSKVLHGEEMLAQDTSSLYMQTMLGTYPYTAPEVFQGHYTIKSDVFSMGLVMFVICELPPYLIPQVKLDLIENELKHLTSNLAGHIPCLGLYYLSTFRQGTEACAALDAMTSSTCLEDERKLFNWMLQAQYQNRPQAAEVRERLDQLEKERRQEEERRRQEEGRSTCIIL